MVFNSNIFLWAFLPLTLVLFWTARTRQQRYLVLTASGYVFYGYWNWRFCVLLLFTSLQSFAVGLLIDRTKLSTRRRYLMTLSIAVDLAILGFFKYYNFFASSARSLLAANLPMVEVLLPIGISFYTFHTISYVVDTATGRIRPTRNLPEYLAYVSLFSQLVAGPIVRFRQIKDDLEDIDSSPKEDYIARGIGFFVVGLFKKVVIADQIASMIDPMIASYQQLSTLSAWMAAIGYAFQIYCDFSGYSDMAVGLGFLFNIRIPQNFNAPYRAAGIIDFWHRWHISLSTWLRDYLYIPLGGSRKGTIGTVRNLMVTMLLGGLWHGAAWHFVLWGAYHGVLLIADRALQPWLARLPSLIYRWGTFFLVVVGWVLFRATSIQMAGVWLYRMASFQGGPRINRHLVLWLVCAFVAVNLVPETWNIPFSVQRRWAVGLALAFLFAYLFVNTNPSVFIYYQF